MRYRLLIALTLIIFSANVSSADDTKIADEVNAKVTQLAALMGDSYSQEYPDYRGMQILRNEAGGITVAAVIFTIEGLEGGNNYTQFMAAFASLSQQAEDHPQKMNLLDVMAIGGKGIRGIEFKKLRMKRIKGNVVISVPTLEYGPKDAMCCPSIKSEAHFIIDPHVGGRLKEVAKKQKR